MMDWNVVVSVHQDGFRPAMRALRALGAVAHSHFHNVLLVAVDDPLALLDEIERQAGLDPALAGAISRVAPATQCFAFRSVAEFEAGAKAAVPVWLPRLANRSFHVRLHRRGLGDVLRSPDVERLVDEILLAALAESGTPGKISFSDPDVVIAIDTVDDRAGMALWSREDLARHPLVRPD